LKGKEKDYLNKENVKDTFQKTGVEEITAQEKNTEMNPDLQVLIPAINWRKMPRPKHGPKRFFDNQE
jgi:hypothetical protein